MNTNRETVIYFFILLIIKHIAMGIIDPAGGGKKILVVCPCTIRIPHLIILLCKRAETGIISVADASGESVSQLIVAVVYGNIPVKYGAKYIRLRKVTMGIRPCIHFLDGRRRVLAS